MKTYEIYHRSQIIVNTDPQRRCYWGVNFSEAICWTNWSRIDCDIPESRIGRRLEFWRELNDYAVNERGPIARAEYKAMEKVV